MTLESKLIFQVKLYFSHLCQLKNKTLILKSFQSYYLICPKTFLKSQKKTPTELCQMFFPVQNWWLKAKQHNLGSFVSPLDVSSPAGLSHSLRCSFPGYSRTGSSWGWISQLERDNLALLNTYFIPSPRSQISDCPWFSWNNEVGQKIHISVVLKKRGEISGVLSIYKELKWQLSSGLISAQISACFCQFWSPHVKTERQKEKQSVRGSGVY